MAVNTWTKCHVLWIILLSLDLLIKDGIDVFDWGRNGDKPRSNLFADARMLDLARSDLEGNELAYNLTSEGQSLLAFRRGITVDPLGVLSSWTGEGAVHHCNWTGITCDGVDGPVTAIQLSGSRLGGSINFTALGDLASLLTIDLSKNNFSGEIRMSNLTSVRTLMLESNNLSGSIPASLGDSFNLSHLNLSVNRFAGPIPQEFGSLQSLETIDLSGNLLRGSIPSALSNCSTLKKLLLDRNRFDGNVEPEIGRLGALQKFSAMENNLIGRIPGALANCSSLNSIYLDHNSLSGTVPQSLGSLPSLSHLSLANNELSGVISVGLMNNSTSSIEYLDLSNNYLTGEIPPQLGQLKSLAGLWLQSNNFSGPIPEEIGQLRLSLTSLDLGNNSLRGTIPRALMSCSFLRLLALNGNHLSGEIPPEIGNLTSLEQFWASQNRLTGRIPESLVNCSFLSAISLDDNFLMGSIPQNIGRLQNLQYLLLKGNDLDRPIPAGLANATSLQFLVLSQNQLSGPVPPQLGELHELLYLDLQSNALTGPIPGTLGAILALQVLDLSYNHLTGEIPNSLTSLSSLQFFNVSNNQLTGPIPVTGPFRNFSAGSYGSNPGLCGQSLQRQCGGGSGHRNLIWIVVVAAVGGLTGSCFTVVTCLWCCISRRKHGKRITRDVGNDAPPLTIFTSQADLKELSPEAAIAATNGFSDTSILGVGSRSTVYLGILPGGATVAVKQLQLADTENVVGQLRNELQRQLPLEHPNLLKTYGLLSSPDMQALVLEYMPQGSLKKQLYLTEKCTLTLAQRLNIALGVAEAMVHLHHSKSKPVIHLDLKPSNILLDDNMEPKVADYGISKFLNHQPHADFSISSNVYGTIGYIPPEYGAMAGVSTMGDVYNFGKVLMELLTRKQPTDDMFDHELSLRSWVMDAYPDRISEILDESLELTNDNERVGVQLMVQLAVMCTRSTPKERPEMWKARNMLQQIASFQAPQKSLGDSATEQQQPTEQSETEMRPETEMAGHTEQSEIDMRPETEATRHTEQSEIVMRPETEATRHTEQSEADMRSETESARHSDDIS